MAKTVFDNDGVAHAWARGASEARSTNGNFYSKGRRLYSYGSHFVIGVRLGVDSFALNTDSYSISTNRQKGDAYRATHGTRIHLPALTEIADTLARIADLHSAFNPIGKPSRDAVRAYMVKHAAKIDADSGAKLESFVGFKPGAFDRAKAEAERIAAAEKRKADKRKRDDARKLAIVYADRTPASWTAFVRGKLATYTPEREIAQLMTELRRSRIVAKKEGLSAKRLNTIRARLAALESMPIGIMSRIANKNQSRRNACRVVRQWLAITGEQLPRMGSRNFTLLGNAYDVLTQNGAGQFGQAAARARRASQMAYSHECAEREARQERERREREQALETRKAAWLLGDGGRGGQYLSDGKGGALLRIVGDTLETGHGADVPLAHAIKAFRFVKMVRERGTEWRRNGKTIRVGHYQIDRIDMDGFTAGCHRINWPEIERVARLAGVFDLPADESAVVPSALVEA